jgi:tRNA-dihydrouridine synthase
MPDLFVRRDPATGEAIQVPYYDAAEVAPMVGVSESHVRRKAKAGEWPHENPSGRRPIFTLDHVERIHELSTVDPDAIPDGSGPARLGTPMSDTDLEGVQ